MTATAETDPARLKALLIQQLTAPVRWTQTLQAMAADGINTFYELGPGNVLTGLVKRTLSGVTTANYDS